MRFRLAPVWWSIGALLVAATTIFSVLPPGEGTALLPDKLVHFSAYFLLGFWFTSLTSSRSYATAGVVLLGGLLELVQGLTPYRHAEWLDFAANGAGAALALGCVSMLPLNVFTWLERHLLPVDA